MSELLEMEEIEMEVLDEYGEVIYSGEFDEYLAINNYDEELEEVLNRVQNGHAMTWTNENGETFTIREVA
jgi:uncharacterized protein YlbG (UPF0298 family)